MATILNFPHERLPRSALGDLHLAHRVASSPQALVAETRRSVQRSLFMLEIAVFQLRRSVPEPMAGKFDQEISLIEALLAAARLEARKI